MDLLEVVDLARGSCGAWDGRDLCPGALVNVNVKNP